MNKLATYLLLCICMSVYAEDLGKIGKTYPIGEQSLLEYIQNKAAKMVQDGTWEKIRQKEINKTEQRIDYPPVIAGIGPTVESSVRYYDPSIKINQDIVDPFTKKVLAHKGQVINPTTYMPFNNELIFIDGRYPDQVKWAIAESKRSKFPTSIVLIGANKFRDLLKDQKHLMFYDQGAVLVKKFGIQHVPTIVYQDDIKYNRLRVEEVKL